jgi:hypothetical protein
MRDTDETVANQVNEVIEVDEEDDQQSEEDEGEQQNKKRKAIAPSSDVRDRFTKVKTANGEERAKCKYVGNLYRCDTKANGKSQLQHVQYACACRQLGSVF